MERHAGWCVPPWTQALGTVRRRRHPIAPQVAEEAELGRTTYDTELIDAYKEGRVDEHVVLDWWKNEAWNGEADPGPNR